MAEISEKTKISLQVGGAVGILIACIIGGKYWGTWESDSRHVAGTVAAHEIRLTALENRMAGIDKLLVEINTKQGEVGNNAATAARFGSYMVDGLAGLREALADRGVGPSKKED
jgi:hypothetical protein